MINNDKEFQDKYNKVAQALDSYSENKDKWDIYSQVSKPKKHFDEDIWGRLYTVTIGIGWLIGSIYIAVEMLPDMHWVLGFLAWFAIYIIPAALLFWLVYVPITNKLTAYIQKRIDEQNKKIEDENERLKNSIFR